MGGKGIRRRERNYAAAHGGGNSTRLPPPPVPSSIDALPSKLRKIMSLAGTARHSSNHGKKDKGDGADKAIRLGGGMESITTGMKRKRDDQILKGQGENVPETSKNEKKKKKRKGKKANDLRFEALDAAAAAAGSRRKDRRKKLSEAKKKKQENTQTEEDLDFPGREHIKFGDIVEAPPKLTVPKALKVAQDASHERLRLQAVEAYRKRKGWGSRPGVKLPPPVTSL